MLGSSASRILTMLDGSHYGVKATRHEKKTACGCGSKLGAVPRHLRRVGQWCDRRLAQNQQVNVDDKWPTTGAGAAGHQTPLRWMPPETNRYCHRSISDERGVSFWRFSLDDPRLKLSRHIVFNLTRPDKSLLLLAPLADRSRRLSALSGQGRSRCNGLRRHAGSRLPGIAGHGRRRQRELGPAKRFDMPGFQPPDAYVREMRRFGILPAKADPDQWLDGYELDQAYWQSLWYRRN